jgi:hypothetical protein
MERAKLPLAHRTADTCRQDRHSLANPLAKDRDEQVHRPDLKFRDFGINWKATVSHSLLHVLSNHPSLVLEEAFQVHYTESLGLHVQQRSKGF